MTPNIIIPAGPDLRRPSLVEPPSDAIILFGRGLRAPPKCSAGFELLLRNWRHVLLGNVVESRAEARRQFAGNSFPAGVVRGPRPRAAGSSNSQPSFQTWRSKVSLGCPPIRGVLNLFALPNFPQPRAGHPHQSDQNWLLNAVAQRQARQRHANKRREKQSKQPSAVS